MIAPSRKRVHMNVHVTFLVSATMNLLCAVLVTQPLSWGKGATGPPTLPEVPAGSTTFLRLRNAKGQGIRNLDLEPGAEVF